MDKAYLEHLQRSEENRVDAILRVFLGGKSISSEDLFRNNTEVEMILDGKQPFLKGFARDNKELLPVITLFGKMTLLEICPYCECARNPDLLEPYLERELVMPALSTGYEHFTPQFAEIILNYPHLSSCEFVGYRELFLMYLSEEHSKLGFVCDHCAEKYKKGLLECIDKLQAPEKTLSYLRRDVTKHIVPSLYPYIYPDFLLLDKLNNAIIKKDFTKFIQLSRVVDWVNQWRTSQAYSVMPQVNFRELEALDSQNWEGTKIAYEIGQIKEFVLRGLKLSYSPTEPLETYLDIVQPRKNRIVNLVEKVIEKADPEAETHLSNLQKEVETINDEVRSLSASTKTKVYDLCTNFVAHNKGFIASCIGAAGLGLLGQSSAACGVFGTGVVSELVTKVKKISMPKETKALTEPIELALEPKYEDLLAYVLSKDVETVQVWRLQRKLGQLKA